MLLSSVYQALENGTGLPEKTVVILFDQSYRTTFEALAPLLAKFKFPAVWIQTQEKHWSSDTRFINDHILKAMKESGTWDVGHYEGSSALVIESRGITPLRLGNKNGVWQAEAGRRALNRGIPNDSLNRLHVNWNWTGQQIIDRLQAETPLRGRSYLTFKKIQDHNWGVLMPINTPRDPSFALKAPTDSRTGNLSWLGTKWNNDAQFDIEVKGLTGEL